MTNFEAISAEIYPYNVDDNLISKACLDNDVDEKQAYDKSQKSSIAMSVIDILKKLIVLSSESNGGFGLSYDTDEIKERIYNIAMENNLSDIAEEFAIKPTITSYESW